jgi:hypothetical protein
MDGLNCKICAKAIARNMYKVVQTIGNTKFGGVSSVRIHLYQGVFMERIAFVGKVATKNRIKKDIIYANVVFIL